MEARVDKVRTFLKSITGVVNHNEQQETGNVLLGTKDIATTCVKSKHNKNGPVEINKQFLKNTIANVECHNRREEVDETWRHHSLLQSNSRKRSASSTAAYIEQQQERDKWAIKKAKLFAPVDIDETCDARRLSSELINDKQDSREFSSPSGERSSSKKDKKGKNKKDKKKRKEEKKIRRDTSR